MSFFSLCLLLLISNLTAQWSMWSTWYQSFKVCSGQLHDLVRSNFQKCFMCALKECCSPFVGHNGLCVSIETNSLIELFTSSISLLLFCLLDILTAERSVVQYHNDQLFFSCNSINFCFRCFDTIFKIYLGALPVKNYLCK